MFSNLSPGAVKISNVNIEQTALLAKRFGFGGIDLNVVEAAAMDDPAQANDILADAGLEWGGFGFPYNFRASQEDADNGLADLPRLAAAAEKVGCTRTMTYIMPGHDELDYKENFNLHVDRLKPAAKILGDHGIRFGLEWVGPKTLRDKFKHGFIHTPEQVIELADAIDPGSHAKSGVLLDSFHWYTARGNAKTITDLLADRVVYVHVNDARKGRKPEEQVDNERALPGETGVIDLKLFADCLRKIDYDGPVAAEPFINEFADQPKEAVAKKVAASVNGMLR